MVARLGTWLPLFLTMVCLESLQLVGAGSSLQLLSHQNRTKRETCSGDQFPCDPIHCIPKSYLCDGDEDCSNGSDENPAVCISPVKPLIEGGSIAVQEDYPWHVGLYWIELKSGVEHFKFKCGGTLVAAATVITAAHCGFDESYGKWVLASNMAVAAGKSKSTWNLDEEETQKFPVLKFIWPDSYDGSFSNYNFDIALIILSNPVRVTINVLPIRINFSPYRFQVGNVGRVAGWGKMEGEKTSADLLYAEVPYIQRDQCKSLLKSIDRRRALTFDKFCGGYITKGPKIQVGDSGGGLVFKENGKNYLVGVVSTTLTVNNFWAAFYTNITFHVHSDWVKKEMYSELIKKYPCTGGDTQDWAKDVGIFKIRNQKSGKVLGVDGMSKRIGADIILSEDDGGRDKFWWLDKTRFTSKLKNLHSGLFMKENGPRADLSRLKQGLESEANVQLWGMGLMSDRNILANSHSVVKVSPEHGFQLYEGILSDVEGQVRIVDKVLGSEGQEGKWSLVPSGMDFDDICNERRTFSVFKIRNKNSGKLLAVDGMSTAEEANIVQWEDSGRRDQLWSLETHSGGAWYIRNVHSKMVIDVAQKTDILVQKSKEKGYGKEVWLEGGDSWRIIVKGNDDKIRLALEVENRSTANGAKIKPSASDGSEYQLWSFIPASI